MFSNNTQNILTADPLEEETWMGTNKITRWIQTRGQNKKSQNNKKEKRCSVS